MNEHLEREKVEFQIAFPTHGNFEKIAGSFQNWMKGEEIPDLEISRKEKEESSGDHAMGPEYLDILNIVFNAAAVAAFVKGFWEWLKARGKELQIELKNKDDKLIKVNSKNFNQEQIITILESLKTHVNKKEK